MELLHEKQDDSHFGPIKNGQLFGFSIAFKYQTIHQPNKFGPSKYWICLVFEPPLHIYKKFSLLSYLQPILTNIQLSLVKHFQVYIDLIK